MITRNYLVSSPALTAPISAVLLADLHSRAWEEDYYAEILTAVRACRPDLILCPGDMLVAREDALAPEHAERFLSALAGIAPVFFSNGNHETCAMHCGWDAKGFISRMEDAGVRVLNNASAEITLRGMRLRIAGLELPLDKYKKFRLPSLSADELTARIGEKDPEVYSILLAHNPQFVPQYFAWGADLVVCGHFHGGMVRLPSGRSLMSPYGFPLPRFGYGKFAKDGQTAVVTSGLGDHTIPFRVNDPEEIVHLILTNETRAHAKERTAHGH